MAEEGLLLSAGAALVASAAFAFAAHRLARRAPPREAALAADLFRLWWYGVSVYVLLAGFIPNLLAAFGFTPLRLFVTLRSLSLVLLLAALVGVTFYFLFLLTGRVRALVPVVLLYAGTYAFVVYAFAGLLPVGVDVGRFETRLLYEPAPDPVSFLVILALLSFPQMMGSLAYLALLPRLEDRTQRFRVLLVGGSVFVWTLSSFVADLAGPDSWLVLLRPALGLVAAGSVVVAYAPPAWLQRRLHVDALARPPARGRSSGGGRA